MKSGWKGIARILFLLAILALELNIWMLATKPLACIPIRKKLEQRGQSQEIGIVTIKSVSFPVLRKLDDAMVTERKILEGRDLYVFYIHDICDKYYPDLDPMIIQAVMQAESNYIPTTKSKYGAVGLMQVIPKYHAWRMTKYGLTDIWDPYTNILVGADFLNEMYHKYGSYYDALLAYNRSTAYVNNVLAIAKDIREGGG